MPLTGFDLSILDGRRIGFAMTGSFCTFSQIFPQIRRLCELGAQVQPILSFNAYQLDTRFYTSGEVRSQLKTICGKEIWHTLQEVEPIGPKKMLDLLIVAPCTGNTLGKLSSGIIDTPVTMAVKSHLRNSRPVLLAVSTNDGLNTSARSIGELMVRRNIYFVPFEQDDPDGKPASLVARMNLIVESAAAALKGTQLPPLCG
ncbi:MAG: dipicolinate synthase subunit B [Clostridia bacterium]|nr:dipicolinate synthase subunit B [Clostridia bacterium]